MNTVKRTTSSKLREKGSKFIGYLVPVESRKSFEQELQQVKSNYPDATHHCYAWRLNPNKVDEFTQDDGEPAGTAGLPILNQLKSFELINCGLIVVRYYGGTNLGKSGLIEAYGETSRLCIEKASLLKLIPTKKFTLTYPYSRQAQIDRLKNSFDLKEVEGIYREDITMELACRSGQANAFYDQVKKLKHLGIEVKKTGDGYITVS